MIKASGVYGELNVRPHWYALHTRSRHEKKVDLRLKEKGINSYLPLNTVYHHWSDRNQTVLEPLFSCYLFVFIALRDRLPVLETDGAVNLVSFCGIPARIPEEQIDAVKQVLLSKPSVEIADAFTPGQKVKIKRGPLTGLTGTLTAYKSKHRVIIAIDAIKQAIAVELDAGELEPAVG